MKRLVIGFPFIRISRIATAVMLSVTLSVASSRAVAASDYQESASPTVGDLYRAFETVVFGNEFGTKKPRNKVLKWTQPLRVSIQAYGEAFVDHGNQVHEVVFQKISVTDFQAKIVEDHLKTLINITNLKTEDFKTTGELPNVTINFVPKFHMANPLLAPINQQRLKRMAAQQGCYFVLWKEPASLSIKRAVIVVNADNSETQISHCILEELTQSLGLPNDTNVQWPSIFSNTQKTPRLSRSDQILLRTLYDPQIKSGMGKRQVMRRAQKLIRIFNAEMPVEK